MAGTTKEMSTIKQVLRYHLDGVSNRKTAEIVGLNKETVNKYVNKAKSDPLSIEELIRLDDPILERRLLGGNPAYTDQRFEKFKEVLPYLIEQMNNRKKTHVTLYLLWQEYIRENPDGYQLTQFRYHYKQNAIAAHDEVSTIIKDLHEPAAKLYLDFAGDTPEYINIETGEIVHPQVFVASLPYSDYAFALAVPSQSTEDFVYATVQCLKHLGGVPFVLVPDNLKAAVIKSDRYEPTLNKVFEDLANHYGCRIEPARVRRPKDKSTVEGQVKIIYQRVYAELRNRKFYSLDELNRAIAEKMKTHNQKRMQQHPYSREEQFLAVEKPQLKPLPEKDFEIRYYSKHKVGINNCIYFGRDKHYYTVPYQYIHQEVNVIYTRTLVKIYADGKNIATHRRDYAAGKYTIVNEHLSSNSSSYRERSKNYYIEKGHNMLFDLGEIIRYMFLTSTMPEEVHYKSCDALLHLARETDPMVLRNACATALEYQKYNYQFVSRLVKTECMGVESINKQKTENLAPPSAHAGIRGKSAFK